MNYEQILQNLMLERPELDVQANRQLLLDASAKPVSLQNLRDAAQRLGNRLARTLSYTEAFATFYANHPEFENVEANTNLLTQLHRGEPLTADSLEGLCRHSSVQLVVNDEYRAIAAEQHERHTLIKELNRPDLEEVPTAELRQMAATAREQRRLKGLSVAELRAEIKQQHAYTEPTVELINPQTGNEYKSREIKALSAPTLRKMLCYPNGQPRPGVQAAFDRILGVKKAMPLGHTIRVSL